MACAKQERKLHTTLNSLRTLCKLYQRNKRYKVSGKTSESFHIVTDSYLMTRSLIGNKNFNI